MLLVLRWLATLLEGPLPRARVTGQAASRGGGGRGVAKVLLAAGSVFELSAGMVFANMVR